LPAKTFLVLVTGGEEVLLVSTGGRPRTLLHIPQCTGEPPQQRFIQPKMSTVLRFRNPDLEE